ncbi:MAG: hypothetical protein ABR958_01730 [Dehalococcoidales bacterium]
MLREPDFFEAIRSKAKSRWDQLEGDPDLAGPWYQLFRQVQSPRHVLSELIQNADDAGATWASGFLKDGFFVFEHNGHDFTCEEFESLCSFGRSNKRRLLTIGFRGIGFKSVFSLGPIAELTTPTITCRFNKSRFTEPEWISGTEPSEHTIIKVRLDAQQKEQLLKDEFERWRKSPLPLLFFDNIKGFNLENKKFAMTAEEPGPCTASKFVRLTGLADKVLVIDSKDEDFPPDCIEEIQEERGESDVDFPPCRVIVVAHVPEGDRGRLHVVLPTGVKLDLPVCVQAPFIQDPARRGIKELASSPVNRWLLGRIGRLLGSSLLDWLGRTDLNLTDRAEAYSLMPPKGTDYSFNIEQSACNQVSQAFATVIKEKDILLNANSELGCKDGTIALPRQVINVWGWETACDYFTPDWTNALAPHVRQQHIENLSKWGLVEIFKAEDAFTKLQDERCEPPPRPNKIESLLPLWSLAERTVETMTGIWQFWRRAALIPVEGSNILGRAKDIVTLPSVPERCLDSQWQFLCSMVKVLDSNWSRIISQIVESTELDLDHLTEAAGMRIEKSDLTRVKNGYDKTGLNQPKEIGDILNLAASTIFNDVDSNKDKAIRILHVAAELDLPVIIAGGEIKFLCQDGSWRTNDKCLVPGDIDIESLLPPEWIKTHVLTEEYEAGLEPKEKDVWRKWARSYNRGGILAFPVPEKSEHFLYSRYNVTELCSARGGEQPSFYYNNPRHYAIFDWDFAKEFWLYWTEKGSTDKDIWVRLSRAILQSWAKTWDLRTKICIFETWGDHEREVTTGGARASWLHRLRTVECIPDDFNHPQLPTELYRRTTETSALEGIEPFVKASWDQEWCRVGLDAFGVRSDPADIQPLLKRLEDLSQAMNPPIGPLRDLYQAIDRVVARLPIEQIGNIKDAFSSKKLARAEDTWEHIDAIFRNNPGSLPGVAVLHHDIADIALWERLEVGVEPGLNDVLNWVEVLPSNSDLSERDRRALRDLLARYPSEVWNKSSRWLNLDNRIINKNEVLWGCRDRAIGEGLFSGIRGTVCDFSMVEANLLTSLGEKVPLMLENHLQLRISKVELDGEAVSSDQLWLKALGTLLAGLRIPDNDKADDYVADRKTGQKLAATKLHPASSLRVQKYLNNSPVSLEREEVVAWYDHILYVAGDIAGVFDKLVRELARSFRTEESKRAIRDCVARSDVWILAYGRQHLDLDDLTSSIEDASANEPPGQGSNGKTISPHGEDVTSTDSTDKDINEKHDEGEDADDILLHKKRQAKQFERLSHYLRGLEYQWDDIHGAFLHPNGSQVIRTQGIFRWKLVSDGDEIPLFLASSSLERENGVEMLAEAWELGKQVNAIFLEPSGESYIERRFHSLAELVDQRKINMRSAVVRLTMDIK